MLRLPLLLMLKSMSWLVALLRVDGRSSDFYIGLDDFFFVFFQEKSQNVLIIQDVRSCL